MPELDRHGSFWVIRGGQRGAPAHIVVDGRRWYRFMDIIYSPAPVGRLSVDLVAELCELRLSIADKVIVQSTHSAVAAAVIDMAGESQPAASHILDFGAGDGRVLPIIRERFASAFVIGADMNLLSLQYAKKHGLVVNVDGRGPLPFADEVFGLVICLFLFHFRVPLTVLKELARITSRRGCLVGNVYGPDQRRLLNSMVASGFDHVRSRNVPAVKGHRVYQWTPR